MVWFFKIKKALAESQEPLKLSYMNLKKLEYVATAKQEAL